MQFPGHLAEDSVVTVVLGMQLAVSRPITPVMGGAALDQGTCSPGVFQN